MRHSGAFVIQNFQIFFKKLTIGKIKKIERELNPMILPVKPG